jgi:hypothetical protein
MLSCAFLMVCSWDEHHQLQFYSERVKVLFCAIYATVNQIAEMASIVQNRDVRKHLIEQVIFICDPLILNCIMLSITSSKWYLNINDLKFIHIVDTYIEVYDD